MRRTARLIAALLLGSAQAAPSASAVAEQSASAVAEQSASAVAEQSASAAAEQSASAVAERGADAVGEVEEIVVTGEGSVVARQHGVAAVSVLDVDVLERVRANHAHEALVRVPGVWVTQNSGQEHLTAIRSPVYTGAGACGEFLFLENAVPIRPQGFCNVNNLFEVNTEQAAALEVVRGPGGAVFGGNAMHGVINTVTEKALRPWRVSVEGGSYEYAQLRVAGGEETPAGRLVIAGLATHTDGYRQKTEVDQQKLNVSFMSELSDWQVHTMFAGTNLDQDTAGQIRGFKAYKDSDLRKTNPTPDAYRDAWAIRLTSEWSRRLTRDRELSLTPYLRRSKMKFLQHFLPGEPVEKNDQTSAGLLASVAGGERLEWRIGGQAEWADGALKEFQDQPDLGTRPQGIHYDYDVTSLMAAGFYDLRWALADDLALVHGARLEWLEYDYSNQTLDGNTRDDGTPCIPGDCLYTRPSDRDDDFTNLAGRLGLEWRASETVTWHAQIGTGFRPPQATELYRLQSGQTAADLDSERVWTVEAGARWATDALAGSVVAFAERSDNVILRDADGFNISDGELESWGVEFDLRWQPHPAHAFSLAGTYARHEYAFDRLVGGGEVIESGNDVDTAPRWYGSAHWVYEAAPGLVSDTEIVFMDNYYLNAANTAEYDGHTVVNWRSTWAMTPDLVAFARVLNVFALKYADRGDFAFGSYRYFPAMERQFYLGFEYTF